MMQGVITHCLFAIIEALLSVLLLIKIFGTTIYHKKAHKIKFLPAYWFYVCFAINYFVYSFIEILYLGLKINPLLLGPFMNPVNINYFQNLFFIGALIPLQIFCYKASTDRPIVDFYNGNVKKKQLKQKVTLTCTYLLNIIQAFLQSIMVGLLPFFLLQSKAGVEVFTTICVFVALINMFIQYHLNDSFKAVNRRWLLFILLCLIMVPLSFVINLLSDFIEYLEFGEIYILLLRGPFLVLRFLQISILAMNIFDKKDLRVLYD